MFDQTLKAIGVIWILYTAYKFYDVIAIWILPSVSLKKYQKKGSYESWALVTGGSAGIGLGCAQELALQGFNIVLLSNNEDDLEDARALIESECIRRHKNEIAVRILKIDASTSTPEKVQAAVDNMDDLNITLLVNNVGGVAARQPAIWPLHDYTAEEVDNTINLNARFMAQLTRLMLPVLAKNGPSLMLNVSSGGRMGTPGVAVYSGTKGFVSSFSNAIAREMRAEKKKVDVLCLVADDVKTQSNAPAMAPGPSDDREFAKAALKRAGRAAQRGMLEMTPWFKHAVQMAYMPEWRRAKAMSDFFKQEVEAHKKGK